MQKRLSFSDEIIDEGKRPDYSKLVVTDRLRLMPEYGECVANAIQEYFGGSDIRNVLNIGAYIGCDALIFHARFGASCICVEHDPNTFDCLAENLRNMSSGVNHAVLGNCMDFIKGFKPHMDFVYLDPPRGGHWEYRQVIPALDDGKMRVPLYDVVHRVFDEAFTDVVVIKVPHNFNFIMFNEKSDRRFSIQSKKIYHPRVVSNEYNFHPKAVAYYLLFCTRLASN